MKASRVEPKKSVLITGSSGGIGLDTSLYLAERGFDVFATMRDLGKRGVLEGAAQERGVRLRILELDVKRPETIQKAVETVIGEAGGIYALVNNAGIAVHGFFEALSAKEIRSVFETNVFGAMEATRIVLPYMRNAGEGKIILMGSVGGRIAGPGASAYCATKFALEGFGESLYQETLPFGISVVLIEPGMIRTEIWSDNRNGANGQDPSEGVYREWFENQRRLVRARLESTGNTTTDVARAVYKALTSNRPRMRYIVGRNAKLVLWLRRYVPGEIFERIYFKAIMKRISGCEEARVDARACDLRFVPKKEEEAPGHDGIAKDLDLL